MRLPATQAWPIEIGLFVVALIPAALPLLWAYWHKSDKGATPPRMAFLQIPYITWFILHVLIAFYGILAVVLLGITGIVGSSTVGTLLGGLFGYVLGPSSHGSRPTAPAGSEAQPQ